MTGLFTMLSPRRPARPAIGFTIIELLIAVTVFGIMVAIAMPRISRATAIWSTRRIAGVVANDLESAFSLASRQRRPVRLSCDCANGSGYNMTSLEFSTPTVDVFPTGFASAALTVTISGGARTAQIALSTAGQVRVLP
jgi:prepilin-type N-terminal cleavage/methylation domain-containing protein